MPTTPPATPTRLIRQGTAGHPVREIILHCAATRPEWMHNRPFHEQVAEIRRWHVDGNRWRDIGYHWLIRRRGERAAGRFGDHFTAAQEQTLLALVNEIASRTAIETSSATTSMPPRPVPASM